MLKQARVLLADDHQAALARIAYILEQQYEVIGTVNDGKAMLEAAVELKPDVVVLDISMPVLGGIAAARQLHDVNPDAKVVFLTIHEDADFAREAMATGACAYVIKHRMASDLLTAVKEALAGRSFISPCPALQDVM